jgi:hypothetical protein
MLVRKERKRWDEENVAITEREKAIHRSNY